MKKLLLTITLAASVLLPAITLAGSHSQGYLTISDTYMSGSMNVRFNNSVPGYMMTQEWTNGTITFYGWNGSKSFLCTVAPGTTWFDRAFAAHYNLDNGSTLYVKKGKNSTSCTQVTFNKRSNYID